MCWAISTRSFTLFLFIPLASSPMFAAGPFDPPQITGRPGITVGQNQTHDGPTFRFGADGKVTMIDGASKQTAEGFQKLVRRRAEIGQQVETARRQQDAPPA